jgi:hypothetical protein
VGLDEIDPGLRDAVIAIEDHRFYNHRGVDLEAIGQAVGENITNLSIRQGGSTITQQLIKNTYIAQEQPQIPSLARKMTEASLAVRGAAHQRGDSRTVPEKEFWKAQMGPKSRFARRRSRSFRLSWMPECSEIVVFKRRSSYCKTLSKLDFSC